MSTRLSNMGTLYLYMLEEMKPHAQIVAGSFVNDESDILLQENIHGTDAVGERLRYVVVRGAIADWAIYADRENRTDKRILEEGVKVKDPEIIKQLINCDEEVLNYYRN